MKRSELPLLFPGVVLLLAAAAYALLFFTSRAEDVPSAVCTAALWQDTLSLKGVVSRGETPVSAPEGAVYPLVPDGERVAAGAPVALAGETGAELFRGAHRITDAARRHERAAFPRGGQRAILKVEYPFSF